MKHTLLRIIYYLAGLVILALGLTLNTKTGLGVSAMISVPYSISCIWNFNFGNMTMLAYCALVLGQFLIKRRQAKLYDLLQIPLAVVFSRILDFFYVIVPFQFEHLWQNLLLLAAALGLTGIGAAMSVNVRLVPNPADGFVQTISDKTGISLGLAKNIFDICNILITISISMIFAGKLVGLGIGTVASVIFIGRVIAAFNHFFKEPMEKTAKVTVGPAA